MECEEDKIVSVFIKETDILLKAVNRELPNMYARLFRSVLTQENEMYENG